MKEPITVCILTAGKGTRMGAMGLTIPKALHAINSKAIISLIIEKFPKDTEFVVGIGFLGTQVKQYLELAHPENNFNYVKVDNFDGPGSGPGYSLLCCKDYLSKPFHFVSCDTLWDNEIDWTQEENWFGVDQIDSSDSKNYCNLKIIDGQITDVADKVKVDSNQYKAFVGLCHIKDHEVFWEALKDPDLIGGEHQISNGVNKLISEKYVKPVLVDWTDVGDKKKYEKALEKYENFDFSKTDETLYIVNDKVIKFFVDEEISKRRVSKASLNAKVFPKIKSHLHQFYSYDFQTGQTLYKKNNDEIFRSLLEWLSNNLWNSVDIKSEEIKKSCEIFYNKKTLERLKKFNEKYPKFKEIKRINGVEVPFVEELIKKLPWHSIYQGIPCFMHGDLQFDNIIYDESKQKFLLLDWRQDFAGNIDYGDLYYDLAKLYGGMILNYDLIKLNLFDYFQSDEEVSIDFAQRYKTEAYIEILEEFIHQKGYDLHKVRLIVGLIFLNMSPLHHAPFDKLLHSLGRLFLHKELSS